MKTYCHVLKSLKNLLHKLKKDQHIEDENIALYMYNDQISSLHRCYKH